MLFTSVWWASAPSMPRRAARFASVLMPLSATVGPAASWRAQDMATPGNSDTAVTRLQEPQRGLGHTEKRGVGGDNHVAGQSQFETATEGTAMHRRHGGKRDILQRIE